MSPCSVWNGYTARFPFHRVRTVAYPLQCWWNLVEKQREIEGDLADSSFLYEPTCCDQLVYLLLPFTHLG